MTSADPTLDDIRLRYTLDRDDWLDGFAVQFRTVRLPWAFRWPCTILLLVIAALLLLLQVATGDWSPPEIGLVAGAVLLAVLLRMPRLLYRTSVRRIVSANPAFSQPIEAILSPAGLRLVSTTSDSTIAWSHFPCHAEGRRVFALFGSDRLGGAVHVLPKRGLSDGDVDQLRALLAGHSRRLGQPAPGPVAG